VSQETTTANDEKGTQIESLARDLAQTINAAPAAERERLRDMAVHLLREEVELNAPADVAPRSVGTVNPFAIGIPLMLVGGVMLVMFPPVGLLLFGAAVLMMVWGVATVVVVRRQP
jgi:hypothetical protein